MSVKLEKNIIFKKYSQNSYKLLTIKLNRCFTCIADISNYGNLLSKDIVLEKSLLQIEMSSEANVFLLVNLGCEMLYVVDQRLKAQEIDDEKSTQGIYFLFITFYNKKYF